MSTFHKHFWPPLTLLLGLLTSNNAAAQTDEGAPSPAKPTPVAQTDNELPDWVTQLPVSMNGKLPEEGAIFWKPGVEKELWHTAFSTSDVICASIREKLKADQYFDDPQVIALCDAIFAADMPAIKRLVAGGVDVKCVGKRGATPLYWAFLLDTDPRPFGYLLDHGADPNVIATIADTARMGHSVSHLTAFGTYNRYFKEVFEEGGDPNQVLNLGKQGGTGWTTPFMLIYHQCPDALERLQLLMDKGAKLDLRLEDGSTFLSKKAREAIESEMQCRMILKVLEAGADYTFYYKQTAGRFDPNPFEGCYFRLIHLLAWSELKPQLEKETIHKSEEYLKLIAWLEAHGESMDDAIYDLAHWRELIEQGQADQIEKEHRARLAEERKSKEPLRVNRESSR
ncbi:ankyrin repeat domain-containing protein [Aeoliella mucimassa]|uniref:Uncharacterized protein n=1 Tax=Aeoliella mucimassa TaxID=2527972 RepID=A0A518AH98_9BACT|nr:hypothetical protein [Aeoliella mucimassa]QDU54101.1 hypothetical protein Pan181_02810 [Aeoliella mucimassa]